jgi:hypothetical protein
MRRLVTTLGAGLAIAAMTAALQPGQVLGQAGASVAETGWWSRQPSGTPGSSFEVARSPDGDLSVAAFRIRAEGTVTSAQLQLTQLQAAGQPSLQVCVTSSAWTTAAPGAWEARPIPTCGATPVRFTRNDVANTWNADIVSFLSAGQPTVSLMVVPAPDESITVPPALPPPPVGVPVAPPVTLPPPSTIPAQTPVPLPFTISFSGSLLVASGTAATPSGGGADVPVLDTNDLQSSDSFFATPEVPTFGEQAAAAPAQVEGRFPQRGDVGAPGGDGAHQPWGRTPLFALAAAAIGAATTFGRQRLRDLGWLGAT